MNLLRLFKGRVEVTPEEVAEFRDLCVLTSKLVATTGRKILPYRSTDMTRFRSHSNGKRVLEDLRVYSSVLQAAFDAGDDLGDSPKLLWRVLKTMGVTPQGDVFNRLENEDVVEIFTLDHWQIFRNMRFFDLVSFTVEEMCTYVWNRDSERELVITWDLLEIAFKIKMQMLRVTKDMSRFPHHRVRELIGEGWVVMLKFKLISPLRIEDKLVATLIMHQSEVVYRPTPSNLP